jgi:hypothetical protein
LALNEPRSKSAVIAASIALVQTCAILALSLVLASADWNEGSPGTGIDGSVRWLFVLAAAAVAVVWLRAARRHRFALVTLIGAECLATIVGLVGMKAVPVARLAIVAPALVAAVLAVVALREQST